MKSVWYSEYGIVNKSCSFKPNRLHAYWSYIIFLRIVALHFFKFMSMYCKTCLRFWRIWPALHQCSRTRHANDSLYRRRRSPWIGVTDIGFYSCVTKSRLRFTKQLFCSGIKINLVLLHLFHMCHRSTEKSSTWMGHKLESVVERNAGFTWRRRQFKKPIFDGIQRNIIHACGSFGL